MICGVHSMNSKINKPDEEFNGLIQGKDESRLQYLSRALDIYMDFFGSHTVEYDGTSCDGWCLAEDIHNEVAGYDGDFEREC